MRNSRKWILMVLIASILAVTLAGCGNGADESAGKPQEGNEIVRVGVRADITSLDPQKQNDVNSAPAIKSIYETLIRLDPETNEFEPYLAESYDYVEGNNKALEFKLHEGVKFHNGEALTAEDVKFSLDRQKSSGNVGHLVALIDNVEVIDDLNFIINLKEETSTILSSLSHMGCSILNKDHVEKIDGEGKSLDVDPIGTGPFKFENWVLGSEWTIVKNEDYWNDEFEAQSDGLNFKVIPEETSRTVALEANELDLLLQVPLIDIKNIKENENIDLIEFESTSLAFLGLNASKAPFDNKLLREAVAHCINRDDIVQVQFAGQAIPAYTAIGPAAIGYTDDVRKLEYDIDLAKEKLAEAGMADGFSFTISTFGEDRARAAEVIQSACKRAGIDVNIETLEKSAYYDKIGNGLHEGAYTGWIANAEPDNTFRPLFSSETIASGGSNSACFKSDKIDELLAEGSKVADNDTKIAKYEEIAKVVAEETAVIPTASEKGFVAKRNNIEGMIVSPILMHEFYGLHFVK